MLQKFQLDREEIDKLAVPQNNLISQTLENVLELISPQD